MALVYVLPSCYFQTCCDFRLKPCNPNAKAPPPVLGNLSLTFCLYGSDLVPPRGGVMVTVCVCLAYFTDYSVHKVHPHFTCFGISFLRLSGIRCLDGPYLLTHSSTDRHISLYSAAD